jgi:hypothetical protein
MPAGSTLLKGETPLSSAERPGNREMGFESPGCSRSSRTLSPPLVATAHMNDDRGECRKDYMDL